MKISKIFKMFDTRVNCCNNDKFNKVLNEKKKIATKKKVKIQYLKRKDFEKYQKDSDKNVKVIGKTYLHEFKDIDEFKHTQALDERPFKGVSVLHVMDYGDFQGELKPLLNDDGTPKDLKKVKLIERVFKVKETNRKGLPLLTKGFIAIKDNEFIRWDRNVLLLLVPLALLLIMLGFLLWFGCPKEALTPPVPKVEDNEDYEKRDRVEDNNDNGSIDIPGYGNVKVNSSNPKIQLYNPESNDVYLCYTIVEPDEDSRKEERFDDLQKLQEYLDGHKFTYSMLELEGNYVPCVFAKGFTEKENAENYVTKSDYNSLEETVPYSEGYEIQEDNGQFNVYIKCSKLINFMTKTVGNKYVAESVECNVIFSTGSIAPGKEYKDGWDAFSDLTNGEHDLQFIVTTFDTESGAPCSGLTLNTKVTKS
jgi:hypothetical protein